MGRLYRRARSCNSRLLTFSASATFHGRHGRAGTPETLGYRFLRKAEKLSGLAKPCAHRGVSRVRAALSSLASERFGLFISASPLARVLGWVTDWR